MEGNNQALDDLVSLLLGVESIENIVNILNKTEEFQECNISVVEASSHPLTCSGEEPHQLNFAHDHIKYLRWTILEFVNYGKILMNKYTTVGALAKPERENRSEYNKTWATKIPYIARAESAFHNLGWNKFVARDPTMPPEPDEETWNKVLLIEKLLHESAEVGSYLLASTKCRSSQELEQVNPWKLVFEDHYVAMSVHNFFLEQRRRFDELKDVTRMKLQGVGFMPKEIFDRFNAYSYEGSFTTRIMAFMSRIPLPHANATLGNGENVWNTLHFLYVRFGLRVVNYNPGLISWDFANSLVYQAGAVTWSLWDFLTKDSALMWEDREALKQVCLKVIVHHPEVTCMLFHPRADFMSGDSVKEYSIQVKFIPDVQECLNNPVELEKLVDARKQNHSDLADKPSCILVQMILLFQSAFQRDKIFMINLETVKPSHGFIIKVLRDLKVIEVSYPALGEVKKKVAYRLSHLHPVYLPFGLQNESIDDKKSIGEMIVDLFHTELFDVLLDDAYDRGRRFMTMDSLWLFHSFLMTSSLKEYQKRFANESFAFVFLAPTTKGAFVKGFNCNLNPIVLDFPLLSSNPTQYEPLPEQLKLDETNESSINHQAFRDSVKRLMVDKKVSEVVFVIIVNESEESRRVNMLLQQTINELPLQLQNSKEKVKHVLMPINEVLFSPLLRTKLIKEVIPEQVDDGQVQESEIVEAKRKMELLRLAVKDKTAFLANYLADQATEDDEDGSKCNDKSVFHHAPLHPWKDLLGLNLMKSQFCTLVKLGISYKGVSMSELFSGGFEIEKANIILGRQGKKRKYLSVIMRIVKLFNGNQRRTFEEFSKEKILVKLGLNGFEMLLSYHFFCKDFADFGWTGHRLEKGFVDFFSFKTILNALVPQGDPQNVDVLRQAEALIQRFLDQRNLDTKILSACNLTNRLNDLEVRVVAPNPRLHHPYYNYAVISCSTYWNFETTKFGLDHLFCAKEDIKAAQVLFDLKFQELDTNNPESFDIRNYGLLNVLQKVIGLGVYYFHQERLGRIRYSIQPPFSKPLNTVIIRVHQPFTSLDELFNFGFTIYPWIPECSRADRLSCLKLQTVTVEKRDAVPFFYFPNNKFAIPSDIRQFILTNEKQFGKQRDQYRAALAVNAAKFEHIKVARYPPNGDTPTHVEATDKETSLEGVQDVDKPTTFDKVGVLC